ncbi:MAG: HEAT repeat domain-containing protein [Clostridia bacterium]|nr:HEAT repeat domain-containing protein [Clostridia bacterium]
MILGDKMKQVERATEKRKSSKLIELAQCKKADVQLAAIRGLGKAGGEDAVNFLVTQLRNISPEFRAAAATALGEIGDPHAKAHIHGALKFEKDTATVQAMHAALAKIADY